MHRITILILSSGHNFDLAFCHLLLIQLLINQFGCKRIIVSLLMQFLKNDKIYLQRFLLLAEIVLPIVFTSWLVTLSAKDLVVAEITSPISDTFGNVFNIDLVSELWEENHWLFFYLRQWFLSTFSKQSISISTSRGA